MGFSNAIKKLKSIQKFDIEKESMEIIRENGELIKKLLQSQLSRGRDGNSKPVLLNGKDFYSDRTVFEKEMHGVGLGKITSYITLFMNGNFYLGMFVRTSGKEFWIESSVPYFEKIIARSGYSVMKLSKESLNYFFKTILEPQLIQRYKSFYGL